MISLLRKPLVGAAGVMMMLVLTAAPSFAQFENEFDPGTPEFQRTWDRTDKPVADGAVSRTWIWGPGRTEVTMEDYAESPNGMRQVQYFDKSRMEITDPNAPDDGLWFVTNGLLVVEMVTGMMQVGDASFENRSAADVNIVGDPGNSFSPSYANIADWGLRDVPADAPGASITRTLSEDGEAMDDDSYASYGVTAGERVTVPGIDHTVAGPFWDFMNTSGPVWEDGQLVTDQLFPNPFYATGLPITEAYWATAPVAGTNVDVLWQCFERRCLTYTPGNNDGFQVEAGNVGQHYWTWRYGDQPAPETFEFTVTIENLTSGQPFSPPAAVTHSSDVSLFAGGEASPPELAAIAQDGDQSSLVALANSLEGVTDVHDVGMPIVPMGSDAGGFTDMVMFTMEAAPGDVLSIATMLICTNDGFTGIASAAIPTDGSEMVYEVVGYDAGVEENTQASEDLVDPCSGIGPVALDGDPDGNSNAAVTDPAGVIVVHEGILADTGDLTPGDHGWTDPVARITINKVMDQPGEYDGTYYSQIGQLNGSGVSGTAELTLDGDMLTVDIDASGLAANEAHAQHIHGFNEEDMVVFFQSQLAVCPTDDLDENEDGFVDIGEGAPAYGGVLYGLEPFPTADADGNISYSQTFMVDPAVLGDPTQRVIVIHGGEGPDGYDALLPVGCGSIMEGELPQAETFNLYFGELNNSGVSATGSISLLGDQLTVQINGSGFEASMAHPQHIHGDDGDLAFCPGPDYDISGDGWVDLTEGVDAYGGVLLGLNVGEDPPTADADGNLNFSETYTVDPLAIGDNLEERVVVLHGITAGEEYVATMPIACSQVVPGDAEAFVADELVGANQQPDAVLSDGSGKAMFWYDDTGDVVYYMLVVNDVDDVTAAHIHQGEDTGTGGVVAFLFSIGPEADPVEAFGILASGRIMASDLVGDLEGMSLGDLVDLMDESDDLVSQSYVNVHSDSNPAGELRDQIIAVEPGS